MHSKAAAILIATHCSWRCVTMITHISSFVTLTFPLIIHVSYICDFSFSHFYRATLCVSAVFAVARCPSVRLSVCHVRAYYPDGWRYRQTSLSARYSPNIHSCMYSYIRCGSGKSTLLNLPVTIALSDFTNFW